jgi:hypothetical protein
MCINRRIEREKTLDDSHSILPFGGPSIGVIPVMLLILWSVSAILLAKAHELTPLMTIMLDNQWTPYRAPRAAGPGSAEKYTKDVHRLKVFAMQALACNLLVGLVV